MALNNLGLGLMFVGRDVGLSGLMGRVSLGLNKVRTGANKAGRALKLALGVGAVGAVITAGAFKLAAAAGTFEQELRRVQNISGASAETLLELRDAAIQAGLATQFSPEEAVEGLVNLSAAGFTADESMKLLTTSLNLASAGQISVGQSTATVANVIKGFSLSTDEAVAVVDKMVIASSRFKIQIEDMNLGLANTIKGASLTGQSIDEMIVSLGIAKNTIVDVSKAGNSLSRGLLSIANKSKLIKSTLGVNVLDVTGKFKSWLDLVVEIGAASDVAFDNEAERTAFLNKALGSFGLEAFATTFEQIRKGASDSNITLAQAANNFRKTLSGSEGAAQRFADNLLDTFKGSTTLLKGTLSSLAIVIGEPFAKVLKPVINAITSAFNRLIVLIESIPSEIKTFAAAVFAATGAVLALGGGFLAARAAVLLLLPLVKVAAVALVGALAAALPLIAVILVIGSVLGGFIVAVQKDVGGLGASLRSIFGKISLFFRSMAQLVRQGGFSGAVRAEINQAENTGLKRFVISLFRVGFRIVRFFRGIRSGFVATIKAMAPTINRLKSAFVALGNAFGILGERAATAGASIPSARFFSAGAKFGIIMARVFQVAAEGVAFFVRLWAGFVTGFTATVSRFKQSFLNVFFSFTRLFSQLGSTFSNVSKEIGGGFDQAGNTTQTVGEIIATVAVTIVAAMAEIIAVALDVTRSLVKAWDAIAVPIIKAIDSIVDAIKSAVRQFENFLDDIEKGLRSIPVIGKLFGGEGTIQEISKQFAPGLFEEVEAAAAARVAAPVPRSFADFFVDPTEALATANRASVQAPEVREARGDEDFERLSRTLAEALTGVKFTIPVVIDGVEIARATSDANRDLDLRGFKQVTAEGFGDS